MFVRWPIPAKGCRLEKSCWRSEPAARVRVSQDVPEPVPCGVAIGRSAGRPRRQFMSGSSPSICSSASPAKNVRFKLIQGMWHSSRAV